jgi:hypothetical protein
MGELCSNIDCNQPIPSHVTRCPICGADAGFPNVRAAARTQETTALDLRYRQAIQLADNRGAKAIVDEFANSLDGSWPVLCKEIREVSEIVNRDDLAFVSFHQLVSSGWRTPTETRWDQIRESAESLMFPYYYKELQYAALSLDNLGPSGYGQCSIVLKQSTIKNRASLLEQNSIKFVTDRDLVAGTTLPTGYRATWEARCKLAIAKLAAIVDISTPPVDFPKILLDDTSKTDCDLIEVQIYGAIHPQAIERILTGC